MNKSVVILTGSNGGIGSAILKELNIDNFLIGLDISYRKNETLKNGYKIPMDLSRYVRCEDYRTEKTNQIKECFPKNITKITLINNAAIQTLSKFEKIKYEDLLYTFDVNFSSSLFLSQAILPELKKYNGSIINIGSIHAKQTKPYFTLYSTAKAALEALTRSMAVELGSSIKVNAISPAAILTPMLMSGFKKNKSNLKYLKKYHPSNSIGEPTELAKIVRMLIEHNSNFLNGSIIDFDGGISSRLHDLE